MDKRLLTSDFKKSVAYAENLYYERCGTCHRAYDPRNYSSEKWMAIMESMKFQAGLTSLENMQISRFVSLFAADK